MPYIILPVNNHLDHVIACGKQVNNSNNYVRYCSTRYGYV